MSSDQSSSIGSLQSSSIYVKICTITNRNCIENIKEIYLTENSNKIQKWTSRKAVEYKINKK